MQHLRMTMVLVLVHAAVQAAPAPQAPGVVVNDVHSRLNETKVARVVSPRSLREVQAVVREARAEGMAISIAGGRHAMGGQQFGEGTILLDTRRLNRVLAFDSVAGTVEVEAGILWPELMADLQRRRRGMNRHWGIRQKQTGADRLSIGGALAANIHGRGLRFKPFVEDVESFTLVDAQGIVRRCSRGENAELFRLAIGGYGLFGVIADVKLRLVPRTRLRRNVEVIGIDDFIPAIEGRTRDGALYGDFQFDIDPASPTFLTRGVVSTYAPVADDTPMADMQKELRPDDWRRLLFFAHADKKQAFEAYSSYYLTTHGQLYWSDTHQLAEYVDDYHRELDVRLGPSGTGTEMITEVYVRRDALPTFMRDVAGDLRRTGANVIYGTVRLIEKDDETFLPWAKERYASIIFNLHTAGDPEALEKTAGDFRLLIDRAIQHGGSYYLTYHRWANRAQVEACYPQLAEFLRRKRAYDPEERFQSEWYRFYRKMFASAL
jgi:FAD/FMN-containing dehydrogenase